MVLDTIVLAISMPFVMQKNQHMIMFFIIFSLNHSKTDYFKTLANSFIISVDGAHAVHPNIKEKEDPTTRPVVNGGPTIKQSGHRTYTSDSVTSAVFKQLCEKAGIKYQCFVNHSS